MKARTILTLVTLALLTGRSSAGSPNKARLRELAELPSVSVIFDVRFSSLFGFSFNGEKPDVPAEIARVRKQLKGDSSDVERYLRLGRLYSRAEQEKESEKAFAQAIAICRQQVREHPDDMSWLARLGDALVTTGEIKEGGKLLRQAVKKAPREWRAWLGLAECVDNLGYRAVVGDKHFSFQLHDAKLVFPALSERKPTAKQIAEMRRLWTEARHGYDRAIELAPFETAPYFSRIGSNWIHRIFEEGLRMIAGSKVNPLAMILNSECAADMSRIARLEPDDPKTISTAVIVEILAFAIQGENKAKGNLSSFENYFETKSRSIVELLPAESQKSVRWGLERLEQLTKNPDKTTAAAASELFADVLMVLHVMDEARGRFRMPSFPLTEDEGEKAKVRQYLRRAVQLDSSRDHTWDLLTLLLAEKKETAEAIAVARKRVKIKDNAHNRYFLAKILAEDKQLDKASEELRAGIKDDPRDLNCRLGMIAVLLKRDDAESLREAREQLDALAPEIKEEKSKSRERSYLLLRGIYFALSDLPAQANELFRQILRQHKDDTTAAQALAALGEPLTQADRQLAINYLSKRGGVMDDQPNEPVETVLLSGRKVTDEDLFFLTPFSELCKLDLVGAAITDVGLAHLKHLTALEDLDLEGTKITDAGLNKLKSLTKLRRLSLSGTQVTDAGLARLECLPELENLSIDHLSGLTDAGLAHLTKLPKLRDLKVGCSITADSSITDKGLARLAELARLRKLHLTYSKITDDGMKHFERLTEIEELWLNGSDITDAGVTHLKGLRNLRKLHLGRTKITDAGLAYLKGLSRLEALELDNTAITDAGLIHLQGLTKLKKLDLEGRPITDAGLSAVENLSQIENLSLEGTSITDAGLSHLQRLKKLCCLNVDRTKVTSQGIAELRKVLPKLQVTR